MIHDADVAVTDLVLALLSGYLGWRLWGEAGGRRLQRAAATMLDLGLSLLLPQVAPALRRSVALVYSGAFAAVVLFLDDSASRSILSTSTTTRSTTWCRPSP